MSNFKDLTGQRFGRLTVIKYVGSNKNKSALWLCKCDCGNEKIVNSRCLIRGNTVSCKCWLREKVTTHNLTHHRLYAVWRNMKRRCYKTNDKEYKNYGNRGITVCDEWLNDFMNFYNWAMANGYDETAPRGKCTIDRINVNGNYEPSNCRFVTNKKQQNNKTINILLTYNGETHTTAEWSSIIGIRPDTLRRRLKYGWSIEKALTTPVKH